MHGSSEYPEAGWSSSEAGAGVEPAPVTPAPDRATDSLLHIRLFGPLRLTLGGRALRFAGLPRTLPLLAYLLLHRDHPTPRDRLAFTLWPDVSEAEARGNLRRHLHDLRRALPPPGAEPWLLVDTQVVQWNPRAPLWLDVAVFEERCADEGRLEDALALCDGDLLPAVDDEWLVAERERLRALQLATLRALLAQQQARQAYPQAIATARRLLLLDPLSEEVLRELLMVHAHAGDRAGALLAYRRFAEQLREELGVDPLPETVALHDAIAAQTLPRPVEELPQRMAEPPQATVALHNLPAAVNSFVGRESEVVALWELLREAGASRLLTLTGPGGAGKTRLALELATRIVADHPDRFPAGVFWVELAPLSDPADVLPAIATTISLPAGDAGSLRDRLSAHLRRRRLLLVLDNFEQVAAAAPALGELLAAAPGLCVLVTSRSVLRLYGERVVPVAPLPLPDLRRLPPLASLAAYPAVTLFVERARAANPGFALTPESATAVAEICVRLDGLPLAIELVAARCRVLSPLALRDRLERRFSLLTQGPDDRPARHRTLLAAIDWSYQLLTPDEQWLFTALGACAGGAALDTIEAFSARAPDTLLDLLASLVDKSLLHQQSVDHEPRFTMLETLREYALVRLEAEGQAEPVRRGHAEAMLALARRAAPELQGSGQGHWLVRLERDHENLRAALRWAVERRDGLLALELGVALWWFWNVRGHLREGRQWLEAALALSDGLPERLRAIGLYALGHLAWAQSDFPAAETALEASLALKRSLGDEVGIAAALHRLGAIAGYQGDYERARTHYEESLALKRSLGDEAGIAATLNNMGVTAQEQGRYAQAADYYAESLARYQALGHRHGKTVVLHNLGDLALYEGNVARAAAAYRESMALRRDLGDPLGMTFGLRGLAEVAWREGQPLVAARLWGAEAAAREVLGAAIPPSDLPPYEQSVAAARLAAGAEAFDAAWAAGLALPLEDAIAEALQVRR